MAPELHPGYIPDLPTPPQPRWPKLLAWAAVVALAAAFWILVISAYGHTVRTGGKSLPGRGAVGKLVLADPGAWKCENKNFGHITDFQGVESEKLKLETSSIHALDHGRGNVSAEYCLGTTDCLASENSHVVVRTGVVNITSMLYICSMNNYIAYYRVSTQKQGASGLGLEAQQQAVKDHVRQVGGNLVAEFTEIESGKNNNRSQLDKAIAFSRLHKAQLLIAKLDRLSRNAQFIFTLRDSQVDFKALDIPDANTLTIGIFAVIAQHERETISARTKAALAARKARGLSLGTPSNFTAESRAKGRQSMQDKAWSHPANVQARALSLDWRAQGLTFHAIADKLNSLGFKTRRGSQFYAKTIQNLVKNVL